MYLHFRDWVKYSNISTELIYSNICKTLLDDINVININISIFLKLLGLIYFYMENQVLIYWLHFLVQETVLFCFYFLPFNMEIVGYVQWNT